MASAAATESGPGLQDVEHVAIAASEDRVILTEDRDFLFLVRNASIKPLALIHYRLDGLGRSAKMARMIEAVSEVGLPTSGTVYTVEPTRIRSHNMS